MPRPVYHSINRDQWAFTWKVSPVLGLRQAGHNENHWFEVAVCGGEQEGGYVCICEWERVCS